jgi:hypothetical protein
MQLAGAVAHRRFRLGYDELRVVRPCSHATKAEPRTESSPGMSNGVNRGERYGVRRGDV